MPSEKTGTSSREPGRPQKSVDPADGPAAALAQALRALREACGNPDYRTLQEYAGIAHQRLAEAARGEQRPPWRAVEGYVRGCWAYQQKRTNQPPPDGAADLARWQQLYRDAGGNLPGESQRTSTGGGPVLTPTPTTGKAASARPGLARIRRMPSAVSGPNRKRLAVGAGISALALLISGVTLATSILSARRSPAAESTVTEAPARPTSGISVAALAPSCGHAASDGFRSPAATAFSSIKTVYTLELEGLAASVIQGTYNGISYDWLEAHPSGNKVGMQLRWSNARGKWYYCTVSPKAGNLSALPDLVASVAVPATINGRRVTYQACIWHQHPYTAQCSPPGI
jgi:hypothetical protein